MAFGTLTEHIYDEIRRGIISGQFEPGERLKEMEMAKRFRASQTPVREALARLAQEGFVQVDRYRGATVSVYSATDFENLYDIRMFLELPAIRMATQSITDKQLDTLRLLLKRGETDLHTEGRNRFEHLDLKFHEALTECSGNPYLAKMSRSNHEKIQTIRKVVTGTKIGEKSQVEHTLIVDAVASHDADSAQSLLREHIVRTRDEVLKILVS